MPKVRVPGGIELEYQSFGSETDPTIVLIAGFGAQLLSWDERLCRLLAERGRRVVRFDNRDVGLSTHLDDHPLELEVVIAAATRGDLDAVRALAPYTLRDMADDTVGLIDGLGVERAHVVGASMGGMIAQLVAIRDPARTATLTSMMSSSGEPDVGQPTPEAFAAMLAPTPDDRDGYVTATVAASRVWSSRRHFDEAAVAARAAAAFDRCYSPASTARQLAAMLATGAVADELALLDVPTLVIHGLDDTLITPSGGERTAELVPGAELLLVPEMGHDRPQPLWPQLVDAIATHTAR